MNTEGKLDLEAAQGVEDANLLPSLPHIPPTAPHTHTTQSLPEAWMPHLDSADTGMMGLSQDNPNKASSNASHVDL